jgi:xylan 1,4-beta-xylosidase
MIINPILPGFHPDPSICRKGSDYYIATSTFNWFPGVRIHHSQNLRDWSHCSYALTHESQLDLLGNEEMGGVWAPCLSYADGLFWLIFTNTKTWSGAYKDSHNYLVTATDPAGPWSEPIYINSSGFDASLFHDPSGRKYFLNVLWNHNPGANPFSGILLQEFDPDTLKLKGPIHNIFKGTSLGLVEGPHLYLKDGYYYLLTAEGGTDFNHAVTLARSKKITGPYEVMPNNPLLTSRHNPELTLQRAGHASITDTPDGDYYMAHLCGRPLMPERRCTLGRETALQKLYWPKNEWPSIVQSADNSESFSALNQPALQVPSLATDHPSPRAPELTLIDFAKEPLDVNWNTLRIPQNEDQVSYTAAQNHLTLFGGESLFSKHRQTLIARRICSFDFTLMCQIDFKPDCLQQSAGLLFFYDSRNYHYLHLSSSSDHSGPGQRVLKIHSCEAGVLKHHNIDGVIISDHGPLTIKGTMTQQSLQFYYSLTNKTPCSADQLFNQNTVNHFLTLGPVLDATVLSDEYEGGVKFTGAYAGICNQDLTGQKHPAYFRWVAIKSD